MTHVSIVLKNGEMTNQDQQTNTTNHSHDYSNRENRIMFVMPTKDIPTLPPPLSRRYQTSQSAFEQLILLLLLSFAVSSNQICIGRQMETPFESLEIQKVYIFSVSPFRCLALTGTDIELSRNIDGR